eukprot:8188278-Heterocapsa_arctica.AAC.1
MCAPLGSPDSEGPPAHPRSTRLRPKGSAQGPEAALRGEACNWHLIIAVSGPCRPFGNHCLRSLVFSGLRREGSPLSLPWSLLVPGIVRGPCLSSAVRCKKLVG